MKKQIVYIFIFAIAMVLLIACGSDAKENPIQAEKPVAVQPYSFFNATTPVIIEKPSEINGTVHGNDFNLSVQLLKYGLVEIGASVQMKPFDFKYGSVEASVVDTDENGVATFHYLAPTKSEYNEIKGNNIALQAIFINPNENTSNITNSDVPQVLLIQTFVLEFH